MKYEAAAWQQSRETGLSRVWEGGGQGIFFIKEQSWSKLNLPVSIAMWMQDEWREMLWKEQETEERTCEGRAEKRERLPYGWVLMRRKVLENILKKGNSNGMRRCRRDVQLRHGSPRLANRDRHLQGNLGNTLGKEMFSVNLWWDNATWL